MRCSVCHQDYKQSDIIDNYFVKDTTEATSTSDEKAAQVCQNSWPHGYFAHNYPDMLIFYFLIEWRQGKVLSMNQASLSSYAQVKFNTQHI